MPYENEHSARVRNPEDFEKDSFRRIKLPKSKGGKGGVSVIIGKLKGKDTTTAQAYRFPKDLYTVSEAKKWLKENNIKYISFEPAKGTNSEFEMEMIEKKKPLLLFAPIYDYVASEFVDKMNDYPSDEDLEIWVNSPGGRVFAGWSIIGAMQKREGKNNVCIMGHAASMSVFFALFADYSEALEVTQFMIHRADGYVDTPEDQAFLDRINKDLRKKMEDRLNMDVFEQVTGKTMNDIFNPKDRINVWIDAKQAKKIGLINKIRKFEPNELKAYNDFVAFADFSQRSEDKSQRSDNFEEPESDYFSNNLNDKKMTLQEFKSQNPELYEQIYNSGKTDGVKSEQTRVKTWLAYLDIDKENVITSIKEGKEFTTDVMAEMSVKMTARTTVDNIKADSQKDITTDKTVDKTEAQKELEAFEKGVKEGVNVKSINIL